MEYNKHTCVSIFHVFIVAPLLVYIGRSYGELDEWMFNFLILLSTGIFIHHGIKAYNRGIQSGWFSLLHAVFFAPLLFYVGYARKETFIGVFPVISMLGFAALGFHLMKLLQRPI